jgi:drug/metabolite transporter (DMT)-like permease
VATLKTHRPGLLLARGFLNFINYCACYYSYSHMPIVNVYTVLFSAPMFLTLFSALFLKERVHWRRWTAVCTGFVGVLVMLQPASVAWTPAMLIVLTTPLTSSFGMLLMRFASRTERAVSIAFFTGITVALCSAVLMVPHFIMPAPRDMALLALSGAFSAAGFLFLILGFRQTGTPLGAPVQYTQLIWATLAGWLIWGHVPGVWMFVGAAIVVGSSLATFYREMARLKSQSDDTVTGNTISSEILSQRRV